MVRGVNNSLSSGTMSASRLAIFVIFVGSALLASCQKRETVGVKSFSMLGSGIINDPKNTSLRFDLLKFGLNEFCKEMNRRGAPLKLRDDQPVLGRFFADQCGTQVIDDEKRHSVVVQYAGKGYGWTNLTGRIGFSSSGLIEYAADFQLHEGAMYVYFRPRNVSATSFQTTLVESNVAQTALSATGVDPDQIGRDIVDGQLKRGFTVIRHSSRGETEFGMGYIPVGQRPFHPFQVLHSDKITLDNDRTEVHSGQQDFIGGFEITDSDEALYLTMTIDGAPAVDVFILPRPVGAQVIQTYVTRPGPAPLTAPPLLDEAVAAGQPWKRYIALPKGVYYLMIDHSGAVGRTAPPQIVGDDRAARVDYLVQSGRAP